MHSDFITHIKFHREMVEDVAVDFGSAGLASSETDGGLGNSSGSPNADIDVVDVLFDDMVAAEPGEVEPVAELPFEIGHIWSAVDAPESALVPVAPHGDDVTDCSVLNSFDGFEILGFVATLGSGDDCETLGLGEITDFDNFEDAFAIDGDGFFHEDVLAGFDCGFEMLGSEGGGSGEDDVVDVAFQDTFVGVYAREVLFGRGFEVVRSVFFDHIGRLLSSIGKCVSEGDDLDSRAGVNCIDCGISSASSTSNNSDFHSFTCLAEGHVWHHCGCTEGGGAGQEISS